MKNQILKKVCSGLKLLTEFYNFMKIEINENQALVILALSDNGKNKMIELKEEYNIVKSVFLEKGKSIISYEEYKKIIDFLVEINCITLKEGVVIIKERMSVNLNVL